jgi:hypothetical protein
MMLLFFTHGIGLLDKPAPFFALNDALRRHGAVTMLVRSGLGGSCNEVSAVLPAH